MANIFLTNPVNAALRMHECGQSEYWFYHKDTYPSDNPLMYQDLIDNATDEIIIWDPYFNVKLSYKKKKAANCIFSTYGISLAENFVEPKVLCSA